MLQILMPMAGKGSRFAAAGYTTPKPFIDVDGLMMFQRVIENLTPPVPHRWVIVARESDLAGVELRELASAVTDAPVTVLVQYEDLPGAVCTTLLALAELDPAHPLLIVNCDQWVRVDMGRFIASLANADACIMTMETDGDPKWSYIQRDSEGQVCRVVEKQPVSREGTVGLYLFARAGSYFSAAQQMCDANDRVNNEFYVAPVHNYLIGAGGRVVTHHVGSVRSSMWGLGTPDDLELFLKDSPHRPQRGTC